MSFYRLAFFLCFITCLSCKDNPNLDSIEKLDGYWEISSVETKTGKTVEYRFNETIDYFEVDKNKGIRTKVKPQLDGNYIKTNDAEGFTAQMKDDKLTLQYKTNFDTWEEHILYLDNSKLMTKNDKGFTYTYRRFTGYLDTNDQTK